MIRITLEQWRAFQAVVEHGGYAQAAQALNKSQSTLSYSVQKLENLLGVQVLEVQGRKARLTAIGEVLLRRSRQLLNEAETVEKLAFSLAQGVEPIVYLAIDVIFPYADLLDLMSRFSGEFPQTRIELVESVLSGGHDLLVSGKVDMLVSAQVPQGFVSDPLQQVEFACVAHPQHPLHQLGRELTYQDLKQHRQIVTRDSGENRRLNAPWLEAEQRWTVSNLTTSIRALSEGLGFAWVPLTHIQQQLAEGVLKPLPLLEGQKRFVQLYMIYKDRDAMGPATCYLRELFRSFQPEADERS